MALIEATLHGDMRNRLTGLIDLDLEHASPQEIVRAIAGARSTASTAVRSTNRQHAQWTRIPITP
ncbi:MAG: hypothetical protein ABSG95_13090 [Solirubrobacteraceae bacterium]